MLIFSNQYRSQKRQQLELDVTKEREKRQGKSKTYTQCIPNEDSYMIHFYASTIFDFATEMKQLLIKYPDTIGVHYKVLVPSTVSFGQFWGRYYYHCNYDKIVLDLQVISNDNNKGDTTKTNEEISLSNGGLLQQAQNVVPSNHQHLDSNHQDKVQLDRDILCSGEENDPYFLAMLD